MQLFEVLDPDETPATLVGYSTSTSIHVFSHGSWGRRIVLRWQVENHVLWRAERT